MIKWVAELKMETMVPVYPSGYKVKEITRFFMLTAESGQKANELLHSQLPMVKNGKWQVVAIHNKKYFK